MTDISETIARLRLDLKWMPSGQYVLNVDDLAALLDAAEAGVRARDAALEEAANLADQWRGTEHIVAAIRALKGRPT